MRVGIAVAPWTTKNTKVSIEVTHDDGGTQLLGLLSDTLEFNYALTIVISTMVSTGKVYSNDRQLTWFGTFTKPEYYISTTDS